MFHSRKVNRKTNHLQGMYLRIVYDDYTSSFEDLLRKDYSFKTHHKNIQSLAIEVFVFFPSTTFPFITFLMFSHASLHFKMITFFNIFLTPPLIAYTSYTFSFISNTFISNFSLNLAKNQANAKEHVEPELLLFENYSHIIQK